MTSAQAKLSERNVESHLTSLAILEANSAEGASYVDNFRPFVLDAIGCLDGSFGCSDVRETVIERFGIEQLPLGAVETILKRLVQMGFIERDPAAPKFSRRYRAIPDRVAGTSLTPQRQKIQREIDALIHRFTEYAKSRHKVEFSPAEAEALILAYTNEWSLNLLRSSLRGEPLPDPPLNSTDEFYVASFVYDLWEREPEGVRYLESLVKGSMLKSALYLPDTGRILEKFSATTVFFDTPLVLAALGVKGSQQEEAARELLRQAHDLGAKLAVFEDTVNEVGGVLRYNADALRQTGRRRSDQTARPTTDIMESGLTYADLDLLAASIEKKLRELQIHIEERPDWDLVDNELEHDLRDALSKAIPYRSERPLDHDVSCLISVHRLRGRRAPSRLERSKAIFISSNAAVVQAGRRLVGSNKVAAPAAMLDHEFATLLWLKQPTKAPDLPLKQLIADCHAALNPSDALWTQYLDMVDHLVEQGRITPDDYYLARFELESRRSLMTATHGKPERVSEKVVQDVLREVKARIEAPLREEHTAIVIELEAERSKAQASAEAHQAEIDALKREAEQRERESEQRGMMAGRKVARQEYAAVLGRAGGFTAGILATFLLLPFVIVTLITTIPTVAGVTLPPWAGYVGGLLVVCGLVADLFWGKTLRELIKSLVDKPVSRWIETRALRALDKE